MPCRQLLLVVIGIRPVGIFSFSSLLLLVIINAFLCPVLVYSYVIYIFFSLSLLHHGCQGGTIKLLLTKWYTYMLPRLYLCLCAHVFCSCDCINIDLWAVQLFEIELLLLLLYKLHYVYKSFAVSLLSLVTLCNWPLDC
jgi:hypothetical protein